MCFIVPVYSSFNSDYFFLRQRHSCFLIIAGNKLVKVTLLVLLKAKYEGFHYELHKKFLSTLW